MHFELVDRILEQTDERIVALKHISAAEEYLQDHFPSFPVLPGVMMIEALTQAARAMLAHRQPEGSPPLVLARVRALKFGAFAKPGSTLRLEVTLGKELPDGSFDVKAEARLLEPGADPAAAPTSASGRLTLRPLKLAKANL